MNNNGITSYSAFEDRLKGDKLKDYSTIKQFQDYFDGIAKYIFGNVAIVIGDSNSKQIKYYLEEIEFYYNNLPEEVIKSAKDKITSEEKKKYVYYFSCTYKRNRKAMQLFWHYSGVDICFQTDLKKNCYGGILIRSLIKEFIDGEGNLVRELIAGPLRCANEIVNQCVLEEVNTIPQVVKLARYNNDYVIRSTIRQGIETSDKYDDLRAKIRKDSDGYVVSDDFPCFCYYVVRGKDGWNTKVDNKTIRYNANPEERMDIIRKVP